MLQHELRSLAREVAAAEPFAALGEQLPQAVARAFLARALVERTGADDELADDAGLAGPLRDVHGQAVAQSMDGDGGRILGQGLRQRIGQVRRGDDLGPRIARRCGLGLDPLGLALREHGDRGARSDRRDRGERPHPSASSLTRRERGEQLVDRRVAILRRMREPALEGRMHGGRHSATFRLGQRRRSADRHRARELGDRRSRERTAPVERLEQRDAERELIARARRERRPRAAPAPCRPACPSPCRSR